MHWLSSGKAMVSISEKISDMEWEKSTLAVLLSACSLYAESGGFVEVSQQYLALAGGACGKVLWQQGLKLIIIIIRASS